MSFFKRVGVEIIRSAIIALVISSTFASAAVWQWSQTSGNNANSDPHIDWHIGMAPSSVGSSSRAEMAELAKYRDDISGLLTTGGTSTAYTVTSNQGLCASPSTTPQDGQQLAVTVNSTNGASPTLTADSCSAYPIQSSAGVAVASGTMISGSPYTLKFSNANSAWMLRDFYSSPFIVPLGALVPYTGSTSPNSNFVLPAGQCISTTTYATYWALMGSPASGGCPGGQFAVLDLRGRVLAALDNLNGSAANRLTNASTGCGTAMTAVGTVCANGVEFQTTSVAQLPSGIPVSVTGTISGSATPTSGGFVLGNNVASAVAGGASGALSDPINFEPSVPVTGTMSGSGTAGGSNSPHPTVQPTIGVTYLLRVL